MVNVGKSSTACTLIPAKVSQCLFFIFYVKSESAYFHIKQLCYTENISFIGCINCDRRQRKRKDMCKPTVTCFLELIYAILCQQADQKHV